MKTDAAMQQTGQLLIDVPFISIYPCSIHSSDGECTVARFGRADVGVVDRKCAKSSKTSPRIVRPEHYATLWVITECISSLSIIDVSTNQSINTA